MPHTIPNPKKLITLAWLALAVLFFWSRYEFTDKHYHTDDLVVLAVAGNMVAQNSWDTNWLQGATAENEAKVPPGFVEFYTRYTGNTPHYTEDGYNLSGYITLCAAIGAVLKFAGIAPSLLTLALHVFTLLLTTTTVVVVALIGFRLYGMAGALCAALVFTVLPITVQDAHYLRPDVYLTFLASIVLLMSLRLSEKPFSSLLWIGVCVGAASAVKPSQLALLCMPLAPGLYQLWQHAVRGTIPFLRFMIGSALCLLLPLIIVFAGTAPWQLLNFDGYLASLSVVAEAYFSPTPPNRLLEFSVSGQLGYITTYFVQTLGYSFLMVSLYGMFTLWRAQRMASLVIGITLVFHYVYFSTVPMFFARSFSPAMPALALAAGVGLLALWQLFTHALPRHAALSASAFIVFVSTILYTPAKYSALLVQHHLHDAISPARKFEQTLKQQQGTWIYHIPMAYNFIDRVPEASIKTRLFAVHDYHDPWTAHYLQFLSLQGYRQIAEFRGDFYGLVPNELTMVHEPGRIVYLVAPKNTLAAPHLLK